MQHQLQRATPQANTLIFSENRRRHTNKKITALAALLAVIGSGDHNQKGNLIESEGVPIKTSVIDRCLQETVILRGPTGGGSGFFVRNNSSEVLIVTAHHVVTDRQTSMAEIYKNAEIEKEGNSIPDPDDKMQVDRYDNTCSMFVASPKQIPYTASVLTKYLPESKYSMSDFYDLALLTVQVASKKSGDIHCARVRNLTTSPLRVGEKVFTIGHPDGKPHFSVSQGRVLNPVLDDATIKIGLPLIETSLSLAPGNSGGALFDSDGKVVGVIVKYNLTIQNRGYAISVENYRELLHNWQVKNILSQ